MKDKIRRLLKENDTLKREKEQWTQEKLNQEQIIQKTLDNMNVINNKYLEEIQRLKEELKKCQ